MNYSYKNWSDEEDNILELLATTNKYSYKQIGNKLNRSGSSCQCRAIRLGLNNQYYKISNKKYTVNDNFWSYINPLTCYWAGFSAADASIQETTPGYYEYSLELKSTDKNHILKLKELCKFTGKLTEYTKPLVGSSTSKIRIYSQKWAEDLKNNFGITPLKVRTIMPPNIKDKDLLLRWLIGYTDGDGCISLGKITKIPYISYVSCNENLINWIKDYFNNFGSQLKNKPSKVKNHNNKYYKFSIGGLKAAQFIDHVNNLNIYYLARKWQNPSILQVIQSYKEKYPNLFIQKSV